MPDNNLTLWLTGATGLVGRAISSAFSSIGARVVSITNQDIRSYAQWGLTEYYDTRIKINFSDPDAIRKLADDISPPDLFIHAGLGGMTKPNESIHLEKNFIEAKYLIEGIFGLGVEQFILVGSIEEYGNRSGTLVETMLPLEPLRKYEAGKRKVCQYGLETARRHGAIYTHVRLSNVLGTPQRRGSLIDSLHKAYQENNIANLGHCLNGRDYLHIDDVGAAMVKISGLTSSTVVNVGSGKMTLIRDLVELYWDRLGGERDQLRFRENMDGENIKHVRMSIEKIYQKTSWTPVISLESGIIKTIREMELMTNQPNVE